MPKEETLARVDADLERGHVYLALQRLSSLCVSYPDDLAIRARRAAVNRQIGNWAEAGRCGYLTEEVTAQELAAFERAYPRPWNQLLALKLKGDPTPRLAPLAAARFAALSERAAAEAPVEWTQAGPRPGDKGAWVAIGCFALLALGFLALLGLAGYGFLKLFGLI